MKLLVFSTLFVSAIAFSQDMSAADNKCRAEAKEIAIKSYQSCVTTARTERLEQIRKEYQAKLADLKKQYETQLQDLKKQNKKSAANQTTEPNVATEPTVKLKKAQNGKKPSKVKTLTANNIITEAELEKVAPIEPETTDTIQTAEKNEATGEVEKLEVVDPAAVPATETK